LAVPIAQELPRETAKDTLLATYNNLESVKALAAANKREIAAIIIEPIAGNMVVLYLRKFIKGLRELCDQEDICIDF